MNTKHKETAHAILQVLRNRTGFDGWWDDIRPADQDEIQAEIAAVVDGCCEPLAATIDRMAKEEAELAAGNVTLHDLAVRRGTLTAEFGTGLGAIIADQFYATLKEAGAENYIEMQFTPKLDASKGRVTVTVKWETGKTPHELRRKAEEERDALKQQNTGLREAASYAERLLLEHSFQSTTPGLTRGEAICRLQAALAT